MGWLLKNLERPFWSCQNGTRFEDFDDPVWCCLLPARFRPCRSISHRKHGRRCFNRPCGVGAAKLVKKKAWGLRDASGVSVSIPRFAWFVLSNYHWFGEHVIPPGQTCSTGWYWLQRQKNHEISGWRPMASYGYGTIGGTIDRLFGNGKMMEDGSLHSMRSPWPSWSRNSWETLVEWPVAVAV